MRLIAVSVCLFAASATAAEVTPAERNEQANAAMDAKEYGRCAELLMANASLQQGEPAGDTLFSAGQCYLLDGKVDKAFAALNESVAAGMHSRYRVEYTDDLKPLHVDPRWPKLVAAAQARFDAYEKTLPEPALHRELLGMFEQDQVTRRSGLASEFKDPAVMASIEALERKHTRRMKEIVAAQGFPKSSAVGVDGVRSAWLLVQHADSDVALQKRCLAETEPLVKTGELKPKSYALLVDRVAVNEKRKQVYGTQLNAQHELQPIEDEEHVDERRKAMGLPPLSEYKKTLEARFGATPKSPKEK